MTTDTKPPVNHGANELQWATIVVLDKDGPTSNLAIGAAANTIQRRNGKLPRWDDDQAWEDLFRLAIENYRELVTL